MQLTAALELGEPLAPVASSTGVEAPAAADGEASGVDCIRNPYSPFSPSLAGTNGGAGPARATLYTNLAVVHVLQGDTKGAEDYVHQALSQQPDNRQAMLCCAYIELSAGRIEGAIDLLKKQRLPKPSTS